MTRWMKRITRRDQTGQAVVILALGFVALLGFVGIVTDVSVLLVRYSVLSRAVDSAAIAAAGQIRSDRNYTQANLAAREMLVFHGLDPTEVMVDTCETTYTLNALGEKTDAGDEYLCAPENLNRKLVRVGARIMAPTFFLRVLDIGDFELSAVAISETAALDIVLVLDVSESMLEDTDYEEWASIGLGQVYVPPTWSQIMNGERTSNRFTNNVNPNYPGITPDPTDTVFDELQIWWEWLNQPQEVINRRLAYGPTVPNPHSATANANYPVVSFPYPGAGGTQNHPRTECRVRFWPYSTSVNREAYFDTMSSFTSNWRGTGGTWEGFIPAVDFYGCCNDPTWGGQVDEDFVLSPLPEYGSYDTGRGDFNFADLICQPFKQARDATRSFLSRVDFDRGDRVSFVTFDRTAFIIDPDGALGANDPVDGSRAHYCQSNDQDQVDPGTGRTIFTHMIEDYDCAVETLNRTVGVRAEPNFYRWKPDGGGWVGFANDRKNNGDSAPVDYYTTSFNTDVDGDGVSDSARNDYPVRGNCQFQNAALPGFFSLYSLWDWNMNNDQYLFQFALDANRGSGLYRVMQPNPQSFGWSSDAGLTPLQSYELQASCRGGNVGAALREANNALVNPQTTRREGTVWVIVFLGDGAAGASDQVRRNGQKPNAARPYYDRQGATPPQAWAEWQGVPNLIRYGLAARDQLPGIEYGWFGLCPVGTPSDRSQLTRTDRLAQFPFCSDEDPVTRNFCTPPNSDARNVGQRCGGAPSMYMQGFAPGSYDADYDCNQTFDYNVALGNVYDVDLGAAGAETPDTCSLYYDVDDYARDWADYVGVSTGGASDEQLPTIFTIGFGLDFRRGSNGLNPADPNYVPGPALDNVPDYLGEELLRYIADVGDNSEIDTDYQQDWRQDSQLTGTLNPSLAETFGPRGPCEDQNVGPDVNDRTYSSVAAMIAPLPPRTDCGNYFNAPSQAKLQAVFDEIASRMFTRLAAP